MCVTICTPQDFAAKQLHIHCECGFKLLSKMPHKLAPHLRGIGMDMTEDINQLILQHGEQLTDFQQRAL